MKLKNEVYDILKDTSTIYLPALASLWLTLAGIWNLPYGEAIGATITAVAVFIGAIIKISSNNYHKGEQNGSEKL